MSTTDEPQLPGQVTEKTWWNGMLLCLVLTDTELRIEGACSEKVAVRDGDALVPVLPGDGPVYFAWRQLVKIGKVVYRSERTADNKPIWRLQ